MAELKEEEKKEDAPTTPEEKTEEKTEEKKKPLSTMEALDKLKAENERAEENIRKQEELAARKLISGETDAGIQPPEKKEETPKEYKDRVMTGKA